MLRQAGRILDLVLPPTCFGCGRVVGEPHALCPDCWTRLTFIGPPVCDACGHPFDHEVPDRALCGACARERPPFGRARGALLYDDASKDLVLGFKHADRTELAKLFSKWMTQAGRALVAEADLVVPVPLHWTRLFSRRYNQAALLARALGRSCGVAVLPDALVRARRTPSQGHLGVKARARNVQGAFRVHPRRGARIRGKRVLLVDDVYTTGATARACAKVLLRGGAASVDVLVLARVVRGFV
ncbi:MAG: ComF family protein [Alphaproteobacteria bacterium]|nr:ComF family protein [Alphaproteobacteria bacterium]MBF0249516.1 ComF family protein [Alphaproteobacteria bacterium]